MTKRSQITEIPAALRLTLEKAGAEYRAAARQVRWGDGPLYVCGTGACAGLGVAAGYAFESFLEYPAVARPVEAFQHYGLSLLRPRSVLLIISASGEWPEAQELAATARARGCRLLVLVNTAESPLAKLAEHVFLSRGEGSADSPSVLICLHAALSFLALEAARALKRPKPDWDLIGDEFGGLGEKADWVLTQLPEVMRATAAEVAGFSRIHIVGGGFYLYPAWQAARRIGLHKGPPAEAMEASAFLSEVSCLASRDAVLFLSGSQAKLRKLLHRSSAQAHQQGARVMALTDSNDRDLIERSDVSLLVPALTEAPASTLALFVLEWLAAEVQRTTPQPAR